jgi:hypothetical protein
MSEKPNDLWGQGRNKGRHIFIEGANKIETQDFEEPRRELKFERVR